jgi:tetratricopeptide (TPR) repeat protein
MPAQHLWIRGGTRADRAAHLAGLALPPPLLAAPLAPVGGTAVVDAHARLRGPYTAVGTVLRALVPGVLAARPALVTAHDIEILSAAPELGAVVPATRETLTSLAVPAERTRYYSRVRTLRMAHGLIEFVRDVAAAAGPRALVVENVEHAEATDREFLAQLLRRADPAGLLVVLCTGAGAPPDEQLADMLSRHAVRHDLPAAAPVGPVPPERALDLAAAYVAGDCVSDDRCQHAAYGILDEATRHRLHDERAAELEARGELSLRLGAIPYHREHGADPYGAGADALQFGADHTSLMGYYHATVDFAARARRYVGWDDPVRRYLHLTSRMTTALAVLDRGEEAEELYEESRQNSVLPVVHMGAAYATAMLYTRHHAASRRDHDRAKGLVNQSVAFAGQLADPTKRLFNSVFMRNGLALVEVHLKNLPEALRLVTACIDELDAAWPADRHALHRSVLRYNRGQVYAGLGMLAEAVADYTAVIEVDPNWPEYHFDRGNLHRRLGRDAEALADYEEAIRLAPPMHEAFYNRGDLRAGRGDVDGALADFGYVLELDPSFLDAYVNRAGLLAELGDDAAAGRDVAAGLLLDPGNAHLLSVAGQLAANAGDTDGARRAYDAALAADPGLAAAWAGRSALAFGAGELVAAAADLDRAIVLGDDAALRYNRAAVHARAGRYADALADLDRAAELAPDDPDVAVERDQCRRRLSVA